MLKRLRLIVMFLSALSTSCWATNGFYLGAGLGPDMADFDSDAHVNQVQNGRLNFNVKNQDQLAGQGIFGTIFAGYGMRFCNRFENRQSLYLAGELNANLSSLEYKNSNDEFVHHNFSSTKLKMQHSYGISLIPGYFYTEATLFYARVGYTNGNFKISTTDTSLANTNKNLNGIRWGLGIQECIARQLSVRMEYSQIHYSSTKVSTLDTLSNTAKTTRFTPQTSQVEFGLVYKFC